MSKMGFPNGLAGKESPLQCRRQKTTGSIPESGRCPEGGNGTLLQYSCLENPMARGV